ncbi:MAG: VOC family protein [Chloroflexi bacterium]|nr:VOC family protein [Chloroflexota bacterium]
MYRINHIHLKAADPRKTARWYVENFGAKITEEGGGMGGSRTVRLDLGGMRINVSSAPEGKTLPHGTADEHYGLEHFGLHTDDIEDTMKMLQARGTEVLLPITTAASGNKISYIKGPDNVRIELVQPM